MLKGEQNVWNKSPHNTQSRSSGDSGSKLLAHLWNYCDLIDGFSGLPLTRYSILYGSEPLMVSVSQWRYHWHFGQDTSLLCRTILPSAGWTHLTLWVLKTRGTRSTVKASVHSRYPWGEETAQAENFCESRGRRAWLTPCLFLRRWVIEVSLTAEWPRTSHFKNSEPSRSSPVE